MKNYPVSPEDCLVLLAIRESSSLRGAAKLMGCDAGGLLRKVQRISENHELLQKTAGKWRLTERGTSLVGWTQETILSQKKLLFHESTLRIASTSWLAERVLIPETRSLSRRFEETPLLQYSIPAGNYERALIQGDCDFVVVCHPPESPEVAHRKIGEEKWTVVVGAGLARKVAKGRKKISLEDLGSIPFVRHRDLNPESFLTGDFSGQRVAAISMDNLIGVRAAVVGGLGWSIVPLALVKSEIEAGLLREADHEILMDRKVCLWWLRRSKASRKRSSILAEWLNEALGRISHEA